MAVIYVDGTRGFRYHDENGIPDLIVRELDDGSVLKAKLSATGKSVVEVTEFNKNGEVVTSFQNKGQGSFVIKYWHPAGQVLNTLAEYNRESGTIQWTFYYELSSTVKAQISEPFSNRKNNKSLFNPNSTKSFMLYNPNGITQSFTLYSRKGKLLYEERIDPSSLKSDDLTYVGTTFNEHGRAKQRITLKKLPFYKGKTLIHSIDELDEDGTTRWSSNDEQDADQLIKEEPNKHVRNWTVPQIKWFFLTLTRQTMAISQDSLEWVQELLRD